VYVVVHWCKIWPLAVTLQKVSEEEEGNKMFISKTDELLARFIDRHCLFNSSYCTLFVMQSLSKSSTAHNGLYIFFSKS